LISQLRESIYLYDTVLAYKMCYTTICAAKPESLFSAWTEMILWSMRLRRWWKMDDVEWPSRSYRCIIQ